MPGQSFNTYLQSKEEPEEQRIPTPTSELKLEAPGYQTPPWIEAQRAGAERRKHPKWWDKYTGLIDRVLGGFYGSAARTFEAIDKLGDFISDKTGLAKGGIVEELGKDWAWRSQYLGEKGRGGVTGEIASGLGTAGWDIPAIAGLGPYGLPVHGGLMGLAEGGVKGAAKGATMGAAFKGVLGPIGKLPTRAQAPVAGAVGFATTPGGIKERAAGAGTLAGIHKLATPKGRGKIPFPEGYVGPTPGKVTFQEFIERTYGKLKPIEVEPKFYKAIGEQEPVFKGRNIKPNMPAKLRPTPETIETETAKLEKKMFETPEELPSYTEDFGVRGKVSVVPKEVQKILESQMQPNKMLQKATGALKSTLAGEKQHKPITIRARFEKAGAEVPEELMIQVELDHAARVMETARGQVNLITARLSRDGVRDQVIHETKVMGRYPLDSLVSIKRERTGLLSTVIKKSDLEFIKKQFTAAERTNREWLKKNSKKLLKRDTEFTLHWLEVPQQFFKRIGLKEIIYNPIRFGERGKEVLERKMLQEVKAFLKPLSKDDAIKMHRWYASKQGYEVAMRNEGIHIPTLAELPGRVQNAIVKYEGWKQQYEPRIIKLAREHGYDILPIKSYSPMYAKKSMHAINGAGFPEGLRMTRQDPWFRSLTQRVEKDVPYNVIEENMGKNIKAFIGGASNFLEIGPKSLKVKYLLNNPEVKSMLGDYHKDVMDWYGHVVNPPKPNFFSTMRRWGYRSILGLQPFVIAKQGISYVDIMVNEPSLWVIPPELKQVIKRLDKPSVTERVPEIAIADMRTKADRMLLKGVIWADRFCAKGALSRVLASELKWMQEQGVTLTNKSLRQALTRVSDRIDLGMGGMTRGQRPKAYRREWGKLALMFTSTINSRFQYYIEKTAKGIEHKDANMLIKAMGSFILGGYLESSITKQALVWDDAEDMAKEILIMTGGNIPVAGSLAFALELGEWHPSPVFANLSEAVSKGLVPSMRQLGEWAGVDVGVPKGKPMRGLFAVAEFFGLPKSVRRFYEGYDIIDKGKRLSHGKVMPITDPVEQFRALMRGQWGPLEVQHYYKLREQKARQRKKREKKLRSILR